MKKKVKGKKSMIRFELTKIEANGYFSNFWSKLQAKESKRLANIEIVFLNLFYDWALSQNPEKIKSRTQKI
jgi:hypothetical protein